MAYMRSISLIFIFTFLSCLSNVMAGALGVAEGYNGFFLEDFHAVNSRAEGRLAVGGSINIDHYSIADQLNSDTAGLVLVAGENIEYINGQIYFGNAIAAGSVLGVSDRVLNSLSTDQSVQGEQALPFDFEDEFTELKKVSLALSQSPANGTVEHRVEGLYLTGDCQSPVQIFNLDGTQVLAANTFDVSCIPDDATIIFNISGSLAGFGSVSLNALTEHRTKTLYNFYQATELSFLWVQVEGSVLAPYADLVDPNGAIFGTIVAKSWNGTMHLKNFPFVGDLSFLSNPPEIISSPVFYTDEKVSYDYDVDAVDSDYNEVLTYSLDKSPQEMTIDAQTGQINWLADDSYTASNAKFNKQCYIVPEGAIEIVQEGDEAKSGRNYIAPLFLGVKEAIKNASNYVAPAAVAWDKKNNCLGCHVQTQSLVGLATSQDKADVDKEAINYLLTALMSSQQANGAIYNHEPHKVYSVIQTALAVWSLSDGLDPTDTFAVRSNALNFLWSRKQGSSQTSWAPEHQTGWSRTDTSITAIVALSASRYLSDAQTLPLTTAQQETVNKWQSLIPSIAEYFLASYKKTSDGNLINALRLVGLSELHTHIQDATLLERIEIAQQYLNDELRKKQMNSGGWDYLSNGKTDPMISAWVGIALNYLQPALTDAAVLKNITYLLDSQAANGTWNTPSLLFRDTDFGATSLVMSYLPVALEHLGNPDLRVSDVILTEQDELPHALSATISNRGLGDVTTLIIVEFYNDKDELLGSSHLNDLRSTIKQTVSINVNEENLTKDIFVRLTVGKDVEECLIGNNEVKAAIVKARVTDLYGNFDTQIFSVNVNDINEAPVITSQPDIEHHQGQEYLYQVQVTDTDIGDAAKFILIAPPAGIYIDERTGQIFSNSDQLLPGEYTITVEVSDLAGLTVEQTFKLTVKANQAPVITSPAVEKGLEKTGYSYQVTASDPNPNDTLSYDLELANSAMSINKNTGLINWQANSDFVDPLISENGLCEIPQGESITHAGAADILVAMDESGSMSGEQTWIKGLVSKLNISLEAKNIGTGADKNLFGLVGFGSSSLIRELKDSSGNYLATSDIFLSEIAPQMVLNGGTEDGWQGIYTALTRYPLRNDTAHNVILVTDEDRDNTNGNITFDSLSEELVATKSLLNAVVNVNFQCDSGAVAFGVDSEGIGYIADGLGGYTTCSSAKATSGSENSINDYVKLVNKIGGASWNLNYLRQGGHYADSFTKAFLAIKVKEITAQLPPIQTADLVVHSIRYDATASLITATVKNRGLAPSTATSVNFFHEHFWTQESVLGNIAVSAINAGEEIDISLVVDDAVIIESIRSEINSDKSAIECSYDNNISKSAITEVRVYDEGKLWDKQKFAVSIKNENDAPTITSLKISSGSQGSNYTFQVKIKDPDLGDAFNYELVGNEENFTIDTKTGEINGSDLIQGAYNFTIKVTDLAGLNTQQIHLVTVREPSNNPPVLLLHPDLIVDAGAEFSTQISATDPEGDEFIYVLAASPEGMIIDSTSGFLRWLPDQDQLGESWVSITAIDSNGAASSTQFKITVENPYAGNLPPSIISIPTGSIYAGKLFEYQVIAEDDQPLNELSFELENKVAGMAITADGLFTWLPTSVQAGQTFNIVVHVNDGRNGEASQSLNLPVNHSANNAPIITSRPTGSVIQDTLYEYIIKAEDKDGDAWTATLLEGPNGLTLEGNKLVWTPSAKQSAMQHAVKIQVEDSRGAISTQSFTVWVSTPAINNDAPTVLSSPTSPAMVGKVYQYQMLVSDPENDPISYQLNQSATGMSINKLGLLTWSPNVEQIGETDVVIALSDGVNNLTHSFTLVAVAPNDPSNPNNYPVINSLPNTQASTLNSYNYQVDATDADGDALTYSLSNAPTGMDIDVNGLITWQATAEKIGSHAVKVSVSDGQGSSLQSYNITVTDQAVPLEVSIVFTPAIINQGDSLTATVYEQGGIGQAVITATLDGNSVSLTANNKLAINDASTGSHTVSITVTKGEDTVTESANFYVQDGTDTTPPVVSISAPGSETSISAPTPLMGSVTDNNLKDYKVMISAKGKQQWTEIASGNSEVIDAQIAMIDPTLLMNGFYDVVVLATDINGAQAQDGVTILVEGELKIGNFSFTVNDLSIPLAGVPMEVNRTYDTRRKGEDLDFGFGWSIDYQNIKLEESRTPGLYWSMNQYKTGPMGYLTDFCSEPDGAPIVSITLPDGKVEKFEVKAKEACHTMNPYLDVELAFFAVGDTSSSLSALDNHSGRLMGGEIVDLGKIGSNDIVINPNYYKLTTQAGLSYYIKQDIGLEKIVTPNGDTITYTNAGIFHSLGKSILFERDSENRITKIIDPAGNVRHYQYDINNDLVVATDQSEGSVKYSYNQNHGLLEIKDPLGNKLLKNIYDESGRLIAQEDSEGNRTEFNHDIEGRHSIITDRLGNTTQYYYNDNGNVTTQINALGYSTSFEYDAKGNQLIQTNALGYTTLATYSDKNERLTETDGLGHTTTFTYNNRGQLTGTTNPDGKQFKNEYDNVGNLLVAEDAQGNYIATQLNAKGWVTELRDKLNNKTQYSYDSEGRILTKTNSLGEKITNSYDINGNLLSESEARTLGNTLQTLTTYYQYNARNQKVKTIYPDGSEAVTEYDLVGREVGKVDSLGRTEMDFDSYGNLLETRYPDGSYTTSSYDVENNKLTDTDRLGQVTSYEYDGLNRLIKSIYPDNAVTKIIYDAVGQVIAEVDENNNRTSFNYDAAGHHISTEDALGNITQFEYNPQGHLIKQISALNHSTVKQVNWLGLDAKVTYADGSTISNEFDAAGRVVKDIDQNGRVTEYAHNANASLIKITDAQSNKTHYEYDEVGNKTAQIDALGRRTQWQHDSVGNVISRTMPEGESESFTYDLSGRLLTHTDFNSNTTRYQYQAGTDWVTLVQYEDNSQDSYSYDAIGRRLTASNNEGSWSYQYDQRDRLLTESQPDGTVLSYQYDNAGNRTQIKVKKVNGDEQVTDYSFDALNNLQTVTDITGITRYEYDAVGNNTTVTYPNGLITENQFDELNRITHVYSKDAQNNVIGHFAYTFDATGRRTEISELDGRTTEYSYDNLYRLIAESSSGALQANYQANYQYDAVGNRTQSIINGVTTAYSYDNNDRLLTQANISYSYDDNGNLLSKNDAGQLNQYVYSLSNRLATVAKADGTQLQFAYNPDAIRIAKSVDGSQTNYVIDSNRTHAQVVNERNESTWTDYSYGLDLLNQQQESNTAFYHYDAQGSTKALSSTDGTITDSYAYDAFGKLTKQEGVNTNNYLYTGEQYDPELDNYYLRARYYDQNSARFTQLDTWAGNATAPITQNKYLYGHSEAVNGADPTGHFFSIGSLMTSLDMQSALRSSNAASYRVTFRKVGKELACIAVEEIATEAITTGIYVLLEDGKPYVGQTQQGDKKRIKQHKRKKNVERQLARIELRAGDILDKFGLKDEKKILKANLSILEQWLIEEISGAGSLDKDKLTNKSNPVAKTPKSSKRKALRKIIDKLDFCD